MAPGWTCSQGSLRSVQNSPGFEQARPLRLVRGSRPLRTGLWKPLRPARAFGSGAIPAPARRGRLGLAVPARGRHRLEPRNLRYRDAQLLVLPRPDCLPRHSTPRASPESSLRPRPCGAPPSTLKLSESAFLFRQLKSVALDGRFRSPEPPLVWKLGRGGRLRES